MTPTKVSARNNTLGALLTMLAMLCFAGMDTISKWLVGDYAVAQLMWIRYIFLSVFVWLLVRKRGVRATFRSARPGLQLLRSLVLVIESAIFVVVFRYLPLADTHAIAATSPLIVIALGVAFLGERAGLARWVAVGAGFVGVLLIVRPGFRTFEWALLLPLGGAVLWAGYQVLTRLAARTDSPETSFLWSTVVALVVLTFLGPLDWSWPTAGAWALMIVVAVVGAISHYALIKALDYAEAGSVQPYSYTLLIWVSLLGWLVFGDVPDGGTILGGAIIVASGLYTWWHDRRYAAAELGESR